jgi:hypothetical protein
MFGVFSAPYASAGLCTSIEEHLTAVIATCKGTGSTNLGYPAGYSNSRGGPASCAIGTTDSNMGAVCNVANPYFFTTVNGVGMALIKNDMTSVGTYCPDGANGNPCLCKNKTNWQTKSQTCVKSR